MSYGIIKRALSVALLVAFSTPSVFALSTVDDISSMSLPYSSSMSLAGRAFLTDKNENITLSLRDSDVKQVLRMFADKAGKNVVFHNSVSGKITLDLVNTPINEAFDLVLQTTSVNYYNKNGTLVFMSKKDPANASYSKQEMMVFPIKYVNAGNIADFLNKNVFSMQRTGMSSIDAATVNSATNELIIFGMPSDVEIVKKVIEQFDKEPFTKTFAVNHTTPAEMADMICKMLLPARGEGGNAKSGASRSSSRRTTGLAAPAGGGGTALKLGEGVVACSISSDAGNKNLAAFNVQNLSISYFPQRGTITLMGGSPAQAAMIENFIKANDIRQPQAYLEVSIVELTEQGSKDFNNSWQVASKAWGVKFDGTSMSGGRPGGWQGNYMDATKYTWSNGTGEPYIGKDGEWKMPTFTETPYKVQMPARTYVSWTMNYLIENRKARVLANPKILITNGQTSVVDLTQDYVEKVTAEYLTSSIAGGGSTSGTAQRNYTIGSDLGIKVELTPFISPEGYVTLNIKPEYSTTAGEVRTQSEVAGQTDLQATLLSRRNLDLKNVRIKDGETLIIGGLIQESEQKSVSKIPFLGDLPFIGTIFRSTSTTKGKTELVIMITPKIINDTEDVIADTL